MQIKDDVCQQRVMAFDISSDSILRYHGRLCILVVDGLRENILAKAYESS